MLKNLTGTPVLRELLVEEMFSARVQWERETYRGYNSYEMFLCLKSCRIIYKSSKEGHMLKGSPNNNSIIVELHGGRGIMVASVVAESHSFEQAKSRRTIRDVRKVQNIITTSCGTGFPLQSSGSHALFVQKLRCVISIHLPPMRPLFRPHSLPFNNSPIQN